MNNKKANPKLLTHELQIIKLAVKRLRNKKFYAMILISVMLVGIFSLSTVISSLMNDVIIRSTGRIVTAPMAYKSEIRGVVMHEAIFGGAHDWNIIAETLASYKIDAVYPNFIGTALASRPDSEWYAAIDAFHAYGIEFHVVASNLAEGPFQPEYQAVDHLGNPAPNYCPIKVHDATISLMEEVATKFDIDGFMFDYIRYVLIDMCYCPECRARFEEWLGEGTITDWTPFYPDGSRWLDYAEWRSIPITELVRDIRNAMLAIKPDLEFSAAVFTYFEDCPIYWRKFMGQDTGNWIKNGYLDVVAPMMYTTDLSYLEDEMRTNLKYMGGAEGKVQLVALLDSARGATPDQIRQEVDLARSLGFDGWILWQYGGPGCSITPDIRDFLSVIDMPDVFTLGDISISALEDQATITWRTDLLATSKVEFSQTPLFGASWELWRDFYYWDINHINGTVVQENTPVIDHSITLTGLSPETQYYFRVQSQDSSGTATSKVLTFTTGEVTP